MWDAIDLGFTISDLVIIHILSAAKYFLHIWMVALVIIHLLSAAKYSLHIWMVALVTIHLLSAAKFCQPTWMELQVRKKGSQSAKVLRDKAVMLRVALEETAAEFCLDMPE